MDNTYVLPDNLTYEEAIRRLEAIVSKLERGDAPLDESMEFFREGVALSNFCSRTLLEMKEEMVKLVDAGGRTEEIHEDA
ncbi:MAG TPA: exodeoxyribonuclease VII small subunit [Clostridiaceae bacterium]|nr:exodeoxyribonuclease VII small subunit [Clostridiaceae bacterium]